MVWVYFTKNTLGNFTRRWLVFFIPMWDKNQLSWFWFFLSIHPYNYNSTLSFSGCLGWHYKQRVREVPACPVICSGLHASDWKSTYARLLQAFMTNACHLNVENKSTYALQRWCVFYFIEKPFLGIIICSYEKTAMENISGHTLE